MEKNVLTFNEACQYAGLSKSTMYKMTMNRIIKHSKPTGKRIYFKKEDLDAFLTRNEVSSIDEIKTEAESYVQANR